MNLAGACLWGSSVLRKEQALEPISATGCDWYRIADGFLGLDCDHPPVLQRWREIYLDCRCDSPLPGLPVLRCIVRTHADSGLVRLDCEDGTTLDPIQFNLRVDPDQRFLEFPSADSGWRFLARAHAPEAPFAAFFGNLVLLDGQQPWEPFVAHYTLHRALRLQRDLMVFHAAGVAMGGAGAVLVGPKGAGKTTLSLALADMGNTFYGDEFTAIRRSSGEMVPFRRAVSIRPGPATAVVAAAVGSGKYVAQVYPDGTPRFRIPASDLVGAETIVPVPVKAMFFLRPLADRPQVTPFEPGLEHVRLLTPLGSTIAEVSPPQTIVDFLRLLRRVRCYFIDPGGSPERTADAILRVLEAA